MRAGYICGTRQMVYYYTSPPHYTATFTPASSFAAPASIVPQCAEFFSVSISGASVILRKPWMCIRRNDEPCRPATCRVMTCSHLISPKMQYNVRAQPSCLFSFSASQLLLHNTSFLVLVHSTRLALYLFHIRSVLGTDSTGHSAAPELASILDRILFSLVIRHCF